MATASSNITSLVVPSNPVTGSSGFAAAIDVALAVVGQLVLGTGAIPAARVGTRRFETAVPLFTAQLWEFDPATSAPVRRVMVDVDTGNFVPYQ